jgi:hypothetical protein
MLLCVGKKEKKKEKEKKNRNNSTVASITFILKTIVVAAYNYVESIRTR